MFFATYGVFEAGNDIARLDLGVEASPRADQRQPIGRILRDHDGKEQPEWYSIVDNITLTSADKDTVLLRDFLTMAVSRKRFLQRGDVEIKNISDLDRMLK